jgi:hypothetical protein
VHYLILGGAEVQARVLGWEAPAASDAPWAVTGTGFRPSVVMHFHTGTGSGAPPTVQVGGALGSGVMTAGGAQWANAVFVGHGIIPSSSRRIQRTDQTLVLIGDNDVLTRTASFVSMDPDGFTVRFAGSSMVTGQVVSLALAGVAATAGSLIKTVAGAPASQTVAGPPLGAVLLASVQAPSTAGATPGALLGLGVGDGAAQASSAVSDLDGRPVTSVASVDRGGRVFVKANLRQIDAEAELAPAAAGGFGLRWTTNDPVPAELTYVIFAAP